MHLGKFKPLLRGFRRHSIAGEAKLCIIAPTARAQLELFSALRATNALFVCNILTKQQQVARNIARKFAMAKGVRLI